MERRYRRNSCELREGYNILKMIVAVDNRWAIGYKNNLLCHLPNDLKRFKQLTSGENKIVVMGRKTLDSLPNGEPLVNRINIVITRDHGFQKKGVIVVNSVKQLKAELTLLEMVNNMDIFIIGGQSIYDCFIDDVSEIYVTKINHKFDKADAYFSNLDKSDEWKAEEESETHNEGGLEYKFITYKRTDK